jgi:serine protease Do
MRLAAFALLLAPLLQDDAKQKMRESLKDTDLRGTWIYDDIDSGFATARTTGQPLMVVFRCVP